jgi:hypothetical protein
VIFLFLNLLLVVGVLDHITLHNKGIIYVTGLRVSGTDIISVSDGTEGTVDWGTLTIGDTKTISLSLTSISNTPIRIMMNTENWAPVEMGNFLVLKWDYNGQKIEMGQVVLVKLTLETPATIAFANYLFSRDVHSFNFDIKINAQPW